MGTIKDWSEHEDTARALELMGSAGISAAEASLSLDRLIRSVAEPSEELQSTLGHMGFESGESALDGFGLLGLLEQVQARAGSDLEEVVRLFPEVRAARAALALIGETSR